MRPVRWLACVVLVVSGCAARPGGEARAAALWFGGDVHLGAGDGTALAALPALVHGEPVVVNLEGPLGADAERSSASRLVNAPGAAAALAKVGVRVAGVENNHARDLGDAGRAATRAGLLAAGVQPAGTARLELAGTRVTVVALDLAEVKDVAQLAAELRSRRAETDALVVTVHVTAPPSYLPTPELEAVVETSLAAGASVVAAHGTHALARVERRGDAVIAWGLGNLAFACDCTEETDGLLLRVALAARGRVSRATVVPVDAGLHGEAFGPAKDAKLTLELLESLGSSPLQRHDGTAEL